MTKLKIKEKINRPGREELKLHDFDGLEAGTFLYSYNWDILFLVASDLEAGYYFINMNEGEVILEEEGEMFQDYAMRCSDNFGPFYFVDKAKITFKVGE